MTTDADEPDAGADTGADVGAEAVSPRDLRERLRRGDRLSILDVRNRDEFEQWHIDGENAPATQIPQMKFTAARAKGGAADLVADVPEPIVVVCGRGEASDSVAELLRENGVDAANLDGGMEGWARLYESVEIPHDEATVLQYQRPSSGCLAYLVVAGGEAAVIDPLRAFADRYVADAEARGATLRYALDTHVHADHVSGLRAVTAAVDGHATDGGPESVELFLPAGARERGLAFEATTVEAGDAIAVGDAELEAVALPGHTSEMTGYRLGDLLFAGDSVFLESVARPDLEVGDEGAAEMARTLHRTILEGLLALPDETRIAPGHYGESAKPDESGAFVAALGDLRERLSPLSMDESAFVDYVTSSMPPQPTNYEAIIETNLGRADATDEEAFELELGPNNCAATGAAD